MAERSKAGTGAADPILEALEIYIAVRYRERLNNGQPLEVPSLQSMATEISTRHANKTEADLKTASEKLGEVALRNLNRPSK